MKKYVYIFAWLVLAMMLSFIAHAVIEIGGNINGLPLPEPGNYEFVLVWNGIEIASRRMSVVKIDIDASQGGAQQ